MQQVRNFNVTIVQVMQRHEDSISYTFREKKKKKTEKRSQTQKHNSTC